MKKIIYLFFMLWGFSSCYDDLGNYKYHEINELSIYGLDSVYNRDQFENLRIEPVLFGEQYSDEDRFEYEWAIDGKVVGTEKNLNYDITVALGTRSCRYIVKDKDLGTKSFYWFKLNVSNSTAGDGIVVLSNYKDKAELSFCRLDRNGGFMVNYYEKIVGHPLGTHPKALFQSYHQYDANLGLQVLVDEGVRTLDPNTIVEPDESYFLDEDFFRRIADPYPRPVFTDFHVEGLNQTVESWKIDMLGILGTFKTSVFAMISGGRYYYVYDSYTDLFKVRKVVVNKESPYGGKLSPATFWVSKQPQIRPSTSKMYHRGYELSNYILMFDETQGQFVYANSDSPLYEINDLPSFMGYKLKYGSHIHMVNYCMAILSNGNRVKGLLLKAPRNNAEKKGGDGIPPMPFEIQGETDLTGLVQANSQFYNMAYTNYMFFTGKDKLYQCNVFDWRSGNTATQAVASLKQYGYDDDAEITCMFLTRSEKHILLGVSRYGAGVIDSGDELKGDVLVINAKDYSLVKKHSGVCGYPVDVMIKYQFFYRDGKNEFDADCDPL